MGGGRLREVEVWTCCEASEEPCESGKMHADEDVED